MARWLPIAWRPIRLSTRQQAELVPRVLGCKANRPGAAQARACAGKVAAEADRCYGVVTIEPKDATTCDLFEKELRNGDWCYPSEEEKS